MHGHGPRRHVGPIRDRLDRGFAVPALGEERERRVLDRQMRALLLPRPTVDRLSQPQSVVVDA